LDYQQENRGEKKVDKIGPFQIDEKGLPRRFIIGKGEGWEARWIFAFLRRRQKNG
jgi:hypothetical protein